MSIDAFIKNPVSRQIWEDRYKKGNETELDNISRVAKFISKSNTEFDEFYSLMKQRKFFPAGRTMSNSGIGQELTLNNCYNANHVGDSIEQIFEKVKIGALTHKAGGKILATLI